MTPALLAIAHDALLLQVARGDARHALRLLISALAQELGGPCRLLALTPQGEPLWHEGPLAEGPITELALERLNVPLGLLQVPGRCAADELQVRLQPVLPALQALLHQATQAEAPPTHSAHADLIRAALAGADTFVWEWMLDNDWLTDIDQGLALLGLTAAEVGHTQTDWNRLIHPDDVQANHDAYLRHERGETPVYEHAYRIRAADGSWRWMLERGRIIERDGAGRPLRMVGTQSDITQRRAVEAAAQVAQDRLASIARSVPQVLFQCRDRADGQREFLYVSEHSRDVLGLTPEQLLQRGEALQDLVLPQDLDALPTVRQVNDGGDVVTEYRIVKPDGLQRWLRVVSNAQPQSDGSTLWHGSIEDVTERRELERSRELAAQAQAASQAKTQFLARMSHELRTPLNAVLGFAQLMEIDQAEPPQPGQQRRLKLVREAGEHLLHMINDMLDLTRIEAGGMSMQIEPVAVRALVQQALELVRATADRSQLQLVLQAGPEFSVAADRTRLRQVLLNLLSNAIKYNRAGGQVVVDISRSAAGQVQLSVRDTGQGIAEADLPQIFEPFHRGAQAAGSVDGAGIGLAVTQALVQLMGGDIQVSSQAGQGSVFVVTLPLHGAAAPV